MQQMSGLSNRDRTQEQHSSSNNSSDPTSIPQKIAQGAPAKILSTGGLVMAILLSLLLGLAYVVRSLKNVSLNLRLKLKRDDRAQKKY